MDKSQKDRLDELQQYTIPAAKYFWISGPELAIHKGFLKYYSIFVFTTGVVLTLVTIYTNFWSWLAVASWNLFIIKLWYITLPVLGIGFGIWYFRHMRKVKQKRKDQAEFLRRRQYENAVINQANKR